MTSTYYILFFPFENLTFLLIRQLNQKRDALDVLMSLTNSNLTLLPNSAKAQQQYEQNHLVEVQKFATPAAPRTAKKAPENAAAAAGIDGSGGVRRRRGRPLGSKNAPKTFMQPAKKAKNSANFISVISDSEPLIVTAPASAESGKNPKKAIFAAVPKQQQQQQRTQKEMNHFYENRYESVANSEEQALALTLICNFLEKNFIETSALYSDDACSSSSSTKNSVEICSTEKLCMLQSGFEQIGVTLSNCFGLCTFGAWIAHAVQSNSFSQCARTAHVLLQFICGPTTGLKFDCAGKEIAKTLAHSSSILFESEQKVVDWRRLNATTLLQRSAFFCLFKAIDSMWDANASTLPLHITEMFYKHPNCWRALFLTNSMTPLLCLDADMLVKFVTIVDANMISFVERAISGVAFAPQSFYVAVHSSFEKMRTFERPLIEYIAESAAETYNLFWNSNSPIEFQRRVGALIALQKASTVAEEVEESCCDQNGNAAFLLTTPSASVVIRALGQSLWRIAAAHAIPLTHLVDLLAEIIGRNMLYDALYPHALADWQQCQEAAREINPSATFESVAHTCSFKKTVNWLLVNAGSTAAQLEMQSGNIGALQKRLQQCLDDDRAPIHAEFVRHGFAVDDTNPMHRIALPILVCYERSQPCVLDSEKDYSSVIVHGSNLFRAYGVFLYTRAPDANQSRFALMMWLSPPYAGEVVVALTPFCQGLIDYYISGSDRTAASGYVGLKYYSQQQRAFVPIDNIISRKSATDGASVPNGGAGGLYNRMLHTAALDLRKSATLRESKTSLLALARPPPNAKTRDSHYFAYEIEESKPPVVQLSDQNSEHNAQKEAKKSHSWRNYVHPAAARRLWTLGYESAMKNMANIGTLNTPNDAAFCSRRDSAMEQDLQAERAQSRALLATWQQNFFESDAAAAATHKKEENHQSAPIAATQSLRKRAKKHTYCNK